MRRDASQVVITNNEIRQGRLVKSIGRGVSEKMAAMLLLRKTKLIKVGWRKKSAERYAKISVRRCAPFLAKTYTCIHSVCFSLVYSQIYYTSILIEDLDHGVINAHNVQ